ncbi:glucose 1-dehydrogenase [Bradyrhizobium sp. PRIMUS42]|uniref:glucose 1-dehydrogenase n=1 Tax=Bradyrhizobium sp. PRIMUS42 TaxID=2908926 RepID=UPI001FF50F9E|nr:glucose 1-dehydrogenase [Bradyrhizobium sp. PRIMUS42]MCJ9728694.1 glucose 1-dehydrogenase [Bradyrhizobium sp. PRIMUS42]
MRLQDKVALITGAASGFGAEIARMFASEGALVAVVDLNSDGARNVSAEIGNASLPVRCDVSSAADVRNAVEETRTHFGRLDIVINNAGTTHKNKPMLDVAEAEFDRVFAVNVKSLFHMAHAAVPIMRAQGGGVMINVGSTAGLRPRPGLTWYNGSKGAANLLTKSMAVELAPDKIRVNGLAPVAGDTPLLPSFLGSDSPEVRAKFLASIPLGRFAKPADVAAAALFLASDEAEFLTGVVLEVDGGRTI